MFSLGDSSKVPEVSAAKEEVTDVFLQAKRKRIGEKSLIGKVGELSGIVKESLAEDGSKLQTIFFLNWKCSGFLLGVVFAKGYECLLVFLGRVWGWVQVEFVLLKWLRSGNRLLNNTNKRAQTSR